MKSFYLNVTLSEKWCNSILWSDNVRGNFGCMSFNYVTPRYIANNHLSENLIKHHRKELIIKKSL